VRQFVRGWAAASRDLVSHVGAVLSGEGHGGFWMHDDGSC
jgi:hypothetical protein